MRSNRWLRLLALFAVLGLVAAACGDDDDDTADGTTTTAADDDIDVQPVAEGLIIGAILPETGGLAEAGLGEPQIAAIQLAINDINAAGGVLGNDVTLLQGDEAGDEALAREAAQRILGQGANAIVGAAASGMSQAIIQLLSDNQIPQCSGSNTSPAFTGQANADYYFRTVPPDEAVAPIIADEVAGDGHENVVIVARADDYGTALATLVEGALDELGATVAANVTYDPDATTFDAEVSQITDANPDAVVVISFGEGFPLIAGLLEAGISADQMYGGDGIFGPATIEGVDPSDPNVVDGMKVIGAAGGAEFNERLAGDVSAGNYIYAGQVYDCAIIIALAAEISGSTDGAEFMDAVFDITRGGTECETFEECKQLIEDGEEDINYNGASGPLELDDNGDPTVGRYAIGQFQDGELVIIDDQDVDVTAL
ncbi:MAG TPA: ABC transporter substrate-binding protein [Acidimicrobiales bacterium]|nr:ABC transporter substrate-binding protein [Acidimicrobiales bacterium]